MTTARDAVANRAVVGWVCKEQLSLPGRPVVRQNDCP